VDAQGSPVDARVAPPASAAELAEVRRAYERYNEALAHTGVDRFVRFMNFGYDDVASGGSGPSDGPGRRGGLGHASARLAGEVLGTEPLDGRTIVDVGCGRGGVLGLVHRRHPAAFAVGADLVLSSLRIARRASSDAPLLVADAQSLPLRTGSVDVIVNIESAVHYPNIAAFYCEAARCLRSGGVMLYADLWLAEALAEYRLALEAAGLGIEEDLDITGPVMAARRRRAEREAGALSAGVSEQEAARLVARQGTPFFEAFASGRLQYRRLRLRRTDEPAGEPPAEAPPALAAMAAFSVQAMAAVETPGHQPG
jgi:SAM-dependent methyltransferase